MAQTFDIRFARSAGLAGLFEEPANEFRWKGAGRLSIDAAGISIAVKRGLLGLFSRAQSRRITPDSLIHVYREGNALRLEFSTHDSRRAVLPIWLEDRDAAEKIVTLLPTQRSVELDDDTGARRKYRFDRKLVALFAFGVVLLGIALTMPRYITEELSPPLTESTPLVAPPATQDSLVESQTSTALAEVGPPTPVPGTRSSQVASAPTGYPGAGYTDLPRVSASPSEANVQTEAASEGQGVTADFPNTGAGRVETAAAFGSSPTAGWDQWAWFRAESNRLRGDYLYARDAGDYTRLEAIEKKWMQVTSRIVNSYVMDYAQQEYALAVSRNWRDHLSILASALRQGGDRRLMELADYHREFAETVEARVPGFPR